MTPRPEPRFGSFLIDFPCGMCYNLKKSTEVFLMKFSIVSRCTSGAFRYQAWPTVAKGEDGTLYAVSSGHRLGHVCPFGKDLMVVSRDEGETWSSPVIVNDTYLDDRDAGLVVWGDNMLLTWFNHPESLLNMETPKPFYVLRTPLALGMKDFLQTLPEEEKQYGSFTRISRDGGKTWSEPRRSPVTAPHGPIRRTDGSLLYLGREFHNPDPIGTVGGVKAYESFDDGETWNYLASIPDPADNPTGFVEPHACQLPDGTIIGALRISIVGYPGKLRTYTVFSYDNGKTWTEPQPLEGVRGAPPHFLLHSSGALILVYSRRRVEPQGQYCRISRDGGKTWGKDFMVSPVAPDWDHGYPSSVELANGDIFTAYYQKYENDPYPSILGTRWSLDEEPK